MLPHTHNKRLKASPVGDHLSAETLFNNEMLDGDDNVGYSAVTSTASSNNTQNVSN